MLYLLIIQHLKSYNQTFFYFYYQSSKDKEYKHNKLQSFINEIFLNIINNNYH